MATAILQRDPMCIGGKKRSKNVKIQRSVTIVLVCRTSSPGDTNARLGLCGQAGIPGLAQSLVRKDVASFCRNRSQRRCQSERQGHHRAVIVETLRYFSL